MSKRKAILIWVILWIPVSFLFPSHPHFPAGGFFAPIFALILPIGEDSASGFSFALSHLYLPALFFWVGGLLFVWLANRWKARSHSSGGRDGEGFR